MYEWMFYMCSSGFKCLCGQDSHLICGRSLVSEGFIHMKGTKLVGWMSDLNNHLKNLVIQENTMKFHLRGQKVFWSS